MKIAVLPDAAMMIVHLITKNGHEYLSSTNITEEKLREKDPYDDSDFDENEPPFSIHYKNVLIGNKYTTNETPSGVRGRLSLFDKIIQESEAAIVIGKEPKKYKHMYNTLNEMILFGCMSCQNTESLILKLLRQRNIPILEVAYPTNAQEIIDMINKVNNFLKTIKEEERIVTEKVLTTDLEKPKQKVSVEQFAEIVEKYNEKKEKNEVRI